VAAASHWRQCHPSQCLAALRFSGLNLVLLVGLSLCTRAFQVTVRP
jgi:hypothetical protein